MDYTRIKQRHTADFFRREHTLRWFERVVANREYEHEKNNGLCYMYCMFAAAYINAGDMSFLSMKHIFFKNPRARKTVRLSDGWCFDGAGLLNALSCNAFIWKREKILYKLKNVLAYEKKHHSKKTIYKVMYHRHHYILATPWGGLLTGFRDYNYNPEKVKHWQIYTVKKVLIPKKYKQ